MTDTTLVFDETPRVRGARTTLEDNIRAAGLPIISADQAYSHMEEMLNEQFPTFTDRTLNRIAVYCVWPLNLVPLFKLIWPEKSQDSHISYALLASIVLAVIGTLGVLFVNIWLVLALIPFIAIAISSLLEISGERVDYLYTWERHTYVSFERGNEVPDDIQRRNDTASQLTNVRTTVIADREDPFLVVERGFGPWKQTVFIGAWNTGTDMDNI